MNTRSKTNQLLINVDINFDEASRATKKHIKNGCFKYVCCQKTLSGNPCKRERLINDIYCKQHLPQLTNTHTHSIHDKIIFFFFHPRVIFVINKKMFHSLDIVNHLIVLIIFFNE